jgi:hypothetical protein
MRAWFAQLFGDENSRADEMAVLAVLSVLTFLCLTVYVVVIRHQPFDWRSYGEGLGSVIFAAAAGMGLKKRLGA